MHQMLAKNRIDRRRRMSEKPRRDITLGEMQDECKKYWNKGNLGSCGKCEYMSVCCHYESYTPAQLNLTDPPRFNEAQMALLKGFYEIGIRAIERIGYAMWSTQDVNGSYVSIVKELGLKENETLDLAELLGKDAT